MNTLKILIIIIIAALLVTPVTATELGDLTVTGKRMNCNYGTHFYINTAEYGEIDILHSEYQKVRINDTITVDVDNFGIYTILKINGNPT